MALLEIKETPDIIERCSTLYVKVDNTNSNDKPKDLFACDFCKQHLAQNSYLQTKTGLFLCRPCASYLSSLKPIAQIALERHLLGNLV